RHAQGRRDIALVLVLPLFARRVEYGSDDAQPAGGVHQAVESAERIECGRDDACGTLVAREVRLDAEHAIIAAEGRRMPVYCVAARGDEDARARCQQPLCDRITDLSGITYTGDDDDPTIHVMPSSARAHLPRCERADRADETAGEEQRAPGLEEGDECVRCEQ